jgi:TRAP-type C4-dicarboxylate transport system permease small subunit
MSGHGQPEVEAALPASGLARFADSFEAVLRPFYRWVACIGTTAMGLLILAILYSIFSRVFGSSLPGAQELTEQGLVVIVFTLMGFEHLGHEKMIVDVLVNHFPKRMRDIVACFVFLLATVILVVAVWQLVRWGMRVQDRGQTTMGTLSLPLYPFAYLSAFGIATLVPIYLIRLLHSIDRAVRK